MMLGMSLHFCGDLFIVGVIELPFISDSGVVGNMHMHLLEILVPSIS
jgi:hypothetical protein